MPYLLGAKRSYASKFDLIEVEIYTYSISSRVAANGACSRSGIFSPARVRAGRLSSTITANGVKKENGRRYIPGF